MSMRTLGDDTVRGGQTVFHGIRMWSQLFRVGVLVIAGLTLAVPFVQLWRNHFGYDIYAASMLTLAEVKLAMGYGDDAGQEVRLENGDTVVASIADIAAYAPWRELRRQMSDGLSTGMWLGARLGAGIVLAMLLWFRWRGSRLKRSKRLRGAELVTARQLRERIDPVAGRVVRGIVRGAAPYRIAGVPYPDRAETQHTIVSGTTGSGKTVLISDLVEQIRKRGERCVIYDKMGSYTQAFFDPEKDVLLNPLDARAPRWSPFFEARSPRDFDMMAAALIPQQKDTVDPFWVTAARQLFSNGAGVLWQKGEKKNRVLVEHLLKTDLSELAEAMEDTVAQSIVDPQNPKTALSVRAMLTANIGAMEVLADSGRPFSIRDWIGGRTRRRLAPCQRVPVLHIPGRPAREPEGPDLDLAGDRGELDAVAFPGRRAPHLGDPRRVAHPAPGAEPAAGLAESRQFGGCFVLGVQVASALRDLYGRNGAETISGLCGTRVVFAAPDRDTAQWSADSLGRSEVQEFAEGVSYGADPYRDGVTLTPKRELQALALPSEIMRLPNLNGYLKLPGPYPVASIELSYVKRPKVAPRFLPAEHDDATGDGGADGDGERSGTQRGGNAGAWRRTRIPGKGRGHGAAVRGRTFGSGGRAGAAGASHSVSVPGRSDRKPSRSPHDREGEGEAGKETKTPARTGAGGSTSADGRLGRRGRFSLPGRLLLRTRRVLREGRPRTPGRERLGGPGRGGTGAQGFGGSGCIPVHSGRAGTGRPETRQAPPGRKYRPPSRPRPDVLGSEVRVAGGARRRRQAHRGRPRPGREASARLGGAKHRNTPERPSHGTNGAREGPENRGGDVPP